MGAIFILGADHKLVELEETPYESERLLQQLLASHPALLRGDGATGRSLVLVRREFSIPDPVTKKDRWSLDHLFLDAEGVPTLVETKRAANNQLRREVVGQMLDYAANAVEMWSAETIRSEFARTCEAQEQEETEALSSAFGSDVDADAYWKRVETNLQAGRIRLIFVADEIPAELRAIVEFLNEQMSTAEVLAIEVGQFVGGGIRTLVPKVIGLTSKAAATKTVRTVERPQDWTTAVQWIEDDGIRAFFLAEAERRPSTPTVRKIYYECQGINRWRLRANKRNVNLWQYMRFTGDVEFWRARFPDANITTPQGDTVLTFNLKSREELDRFRDIVLTDGPRLAFLSRNQPAEPAS